MTTSSPTADITTDTVELTCTPSDGILTVSAETVARLDRLATSLPRGTWQIEVRLPTATLTARPARHRQETAA